MLTLKSFIPRRRWFRFSLAAFLIGVAVIGVGLKMVLDRVYFCARQLEIADDLKLSGSLPRVQPWSLAQPVGWEKTLADWIGMKYEHDIVGLRFTSPFDFSPKDMDVVERMPKLRSIVVVGHILSDDAISALMRITQINTLEFMTTDVTLDEVSRLKAALPHVHIRAWDFYDDQSPFPKINVLADLP